MSKTIVSVLCALLAASSTVACSGSTSDASPAATQETKQTLTFQGDCSAAACSSPPSNLATAPVVTCAAGTAAECQWGTSDPNATVSYRECSAAECPAKPDFTCPSGTSLATQVCGSENDAACAWASSCVPPRDTTPCPQANGCDGQPMIEIGIICKDGSTGAFACVTDGKQCHLERNCD